jgi:uncharacterized membrane protein YhaH (DUF805 family)
MSDLFTLEGRCNRAKYFWISLAIAVLANVLAFLLGAVVGAAGGDQFTGTILSLFISVPAMLMVAFLIVRRLHDLGRPGWHYWLLIVPFYNIYLAFVLLFQKGSTGENQYGPDPLAV